MDPKNVKLPLIVRLKILKQACDANDGVYAAIFGTIFFYTPGLLLALNVPAFMLGPISQFIVTFMLSIVFAGAILGLFFVAYKTYEEDLEPLIRNVKTSYSEKALPLQKAEMEKIDDILLDNK